MFSPSHLQGLVTWPWAEATMVLFGFCWGAMLGSFLNVVAHRLPRGESLVRHRSRCPRCGAAVRATDNVPVIGWLRLGGRCRDCGGTIAVRYPLVEAGCGVIVMVLAWTELVGGGRWQPRSRDQFPQGIDRLLQGDWSVLVASGLHAAVLLGVVALVPTVAPGGVLPSGADWPPTGLRVPAVAASLAGIAWGSLLGRAGAGNGIRLGLPLLGSVLGWQAVTVVAVLTAITWRAVGPPRTAALGTAGLLLVAYGTLGLAFQGPIHAGVGRALAVFLPR